MNEDGEEEGLVQQLPNEVLAIVLEYLSHAVEEAIGQYRLVCHRWCEIIDNTNKIVIFEVKFFDHQLQC